MPPTTPHSSLRRPRSRPKYRAARAFYLFLFIAACFATFAILSQPSNPSGTYSNQENILLLRHRKRDNISTQLNDDEQCRLVHRAKDQCAFIKKQCPSEEPGFSAYLDLYYCQLPHIKGAGFMILISWLGLLFSTIGIAASDFFCINLSTIATILGMSESMAGVTFLAFGNGSPDVFSTFAAMSTNSGSLAVGELFGAAGFITAVVSGSMALIRPFHVARKSFVRDVGFFVVAAAFSMVFLWDGKLHFWECLAMVLFYVFYVAFVVVWHWWLNRRRRRREKEAAARGHFIAPEELEFEEEGEYRDDPDEAPSRPSVSRGISAVSREDWSALERGAGVEQYTDETDEDEEEHARDRWMSELNSNMRLTNPQARSRKNTLTPVRPSLVGALEFQAVLKSLQKSRNIQTYPMNTRRYSDDPTYTTAQQQDRMSTVSDPASRPPYEVQVYDDATTPTLERPSLDVPRTVPNRNRAVSANDAHGLRIDPDLQRTSTRRGRSPEQENLIDLSDSERDAQAQSRQSRDSLRVPSPSVEISLSTPQQSVPDNANAPGAAASSVSRSSEFLAPPDGTPPQIVRQTSDLSNRSGRIGRSQIREHDTPADSPRAVPNVKSLPKIVIPRRERSPSLTPKSSPFPRYRDDPSPPGSRSPSLFLPPPASPESLPVSQTAEHQEGVGVPKRPTLLDRWWPYTVLPPPGVMISTLFPTIYHWRDKNYWEKALGVVAAPSVFLLTITLPVVESGKEEEEEGGMAKDNSFDSTRSRSGGGGNPGDNKGSVGSGGEVLNDPQIHVQEHSTSTSGGTAHVAAATEDQHHSHHSDNSASPAVILDQQSHDLVSEPEQHPYHHHPDLWNRWLLITQLFLAPLFIVMAIYSQSPTDITPTWLIQPTLICLLVSLVLLIPLLLTTTPTHKPRPYRPLLSLAGFIVSISWISTIASQVVGALKALAVILNMSHAIMGLTIFAVGNSLGDLVADVTVARIGYPIMALSACFGGPMLNILLGIGLSGSYILLRGARERAHKHPDKEFKFKSYHIDVEDTLIISGATLLVTLAGLLVAVPMNKWVFSKRIGWTLIAVWVLSTVGNVVVEVTGWTGKGGKEALVGLV